MVATDVGIYVLNASSTTWVNNSFGLPNVIVSDIEFNEALNKVYISTFGRGIWQTNINTITGLNPQLNHIYQYLLYPTVNNGNFTLVYNDDKNEKTCISRKH